MVREKGISLLLTEMINFVIPDLIPRVPEHILASGAVFNSKWVDGDLNTARIPKKLTKF